MGLGWVRDVTVGLRLGSCSGLGALVGWYGRLGEEVVGGLLFEGCWG